MPGKPRTEPTSQAMERARHFDAIVALVESGATVREAIPRVSNCLTFDGFRKWVKRNPDADARMKAAQRKRDAGPNAIMKRPGRKKPPPPAAPVRDALRARLPEIIAAIEAGADVRDAYKITGYNDYASVRRWVNRDPAVQSRILAAQQIARDRSTFSDANYECALEAMIAHDGVLDKARFCGISYGAMIQRGIDHPEFKRKLDEACALRNDRLGIVIVRLTKQEKQAREDRRREWHAKQARRRAARIPPPTPLTKDQLRRPLLENPLYRNATRLLRLADSQDRDDIVSDAIVAMLESRQISRRDLVHEHHRKVSSLNMISTDQRFGDVTPLDNFRTDTINWAA